RLSENDYEIKQVITGGAATVGAVMNSVHLQPKQGLKMPNGRDVFVNACEHMTTVSRKIMDNHHITIDDIAFFIPLQANLRISKNVAAQLNLAEEKMVSNI